MISPERIYLNSQGEAVRESDPDARELLVGEGCEISEVEAERYGLPLEPEETTDVDGAEGVSPSDETTAKTPKPRNGRKNTAPANG